MLEAGAVDLDPPKSEETDGPSNPLFAPESQPDEILIRLEGDFASEGQFGLRVLEVSARFVRILEADGTRRREIPIAAIESARNEPLVGGGRLEILTKSGDLIPAIT